MIQEPFGAPFEVVELVLHVPKVQVAAGAM
jgi:hypothetical protein